MSHIVWLALGLLAGYIVLDPLLAVGCLMVHLPPPRSSWVGTHELSIVLRRPVWRLLAFPPVAITFLILGLPLGRILYVYDGWQPLMAGLTTGAVIRVVAHIAASSERSVRTTMHSKK